MNRKNEQGEETEEGGEAMPIQIKRAYEKVAEEDGMRILVDRLWPRGVSKEKLKINHWMKEIAPFTSLRQWFGHDPEKFEEFKKRYQKELASGEQKEQLKKLKELAIQEKKHLTLIFAAKNEQHNQAVILKEILDDQQI